ncbi:MULTISPECIES: Asp23/Gls24 family envelope stress response protein [unclassified Vagococcus]|uniref:Asp23/Gls24 family envelope stress response protein n=1 Tax=unclassified Vagococcus TaxID=2648499 RepID=UPI001F50F564|nr:MULTISPECIES: Asp23/Gls24 family envelope stress response protein [unclassified Vagococcus]MCI0130985.1 Asp23/Gls24 family envelope stress response protein [Vagococcus sp. CY53-2]UNM89439.1 Asp23/Gls24 family envelope stress response protein [Vagococcus sp. CY52-2]
MSNKNEDKKSKVTDTKGQNQNQTIKGDLTFDDKVIQKIIGIALEEIEGLLTVDGGFLSNLAGKIVNTDDVTSGIDVEVGKEQVAVDLDVVCEYGRNMNNIYDSIKEITTREVKKMTGLNVVEVNVNVVDVKSKEQYEEENTTVQDKLSEAAENTSNFVSKKTDNVKEATSDVRDKLSDQVSNIEDNVMGSRVK